MKEELSSSYFQIKKGETRMKKIIIWTIIIVAVHTAIWKFLVLDRQDEIITNYVQYVERSLSNCNSQLLTENEQAFCHFLKDTNATTYLEAKIKSASKLNLLYMEIGLNAPVYMDWLEEEYILFSQR
jgi:branched-subunit amino acid transport protein AzlD